VSRTEINYKGKRKDGSVLVSRRQRWKKNTLVNLSTFKIENIIMITSMTMTMMIMIMMMMMMTMTAMMTMTMIMIF